MKESDVPRGNDYAPRTFRSYHHRVSEGPIPPIWPQNRASGLPKLNAHSTFANPWTSGQSHESTAMHPMPFTRSSIPKVIGAKRTGPLNYQPSPPRRWSPLRKLPHRLSA